jgi:hypothetical protein
MDIISSYGKNYIELQYGDKIKIKLIGDLSQCARDSYPKITENR